MIFLCCLERNKTWKSKQRSEKGIAHRPKRSEKQHTKQWKKELYSALMTSWTKKAPNMKRIALKAAPSHVVIPLRMI